MRPPCVEIEWGDGTHRFALPIGRLRELQEKTGAGPYALYRRILSGDWRVDDMAETLRLGLIGGGAAPMAALQLVKRYAEERPLLESVDPALRVLAWALAPEKGEDADAEDGDGNASAKKPRAAEREAPAPPPETNPPPAT